jgi:hypothetical protein
MVFSNNLLLGAVSAAAGDYLIEQSLLFNDNDSAYLNRTPSVAGNRKTWTFSVWVARGNLAKDTYIFSGGSTSSYYVNLYFDTSDRIVTQISNNGVVGHIVTTAKYRDTAAWYHITLTVDTTNATAANRQRIYVNGDEVTAFDTKINPSQNLDTYVNSTEVHILGAPNWYINPSVMMDGLMALPILVDGAALDPTSFGELDDDGYWNPIDFTGADTQSPLDLSGLSYFGDMTGQAGLSAAFDGDTTKTRAQSASDTTTTTDSYVGVDHGVGNTETVTGFFAYGTSNFGFGNQASFTISLYGSNTLPASETDGTLLYSTGSFANSNSIIVGANSGITSGAYRYHWARIQPVSGDTTEIAQVQLLTTSASAGFGTNGFELDYADTAAFGADVKTNTNTMTPTFEAQYYNTSNLTTYTFSACDLGTADADRSIIVAVGAGRVSAGSRTVSSLTIGGVSATFAGRKQTVNLNANEIWYAKVPTGATGDVVVTFNSGMLGCGIGIWSVLNLGSVQDVQGDNTSGGVASQSVSIGGGESAFAVFNVYDEANPPGISAVSWSTATERYEDLTVEGQSSLMGADYTFSTSSNATTVTATYTGTGGNDGSLLGVTFGKPNDNFYKANNFTAADQLADTPTDSADDGIGNFATWGLANYKFSGGSGAPDFSDGNLVIGSSAYDGAYKHTWSLPSTGKWAVKLQGDAGISTRHYAIGIMPLSTAVASAGSVPLVSGGCDGYAYGSNGNKFDAAGSESAYGSNWGTGAAIEVVWDADNGDLICYYNGVSQGTLVSGLTGEWVFFFIINNTTRTFTFDFGQRGYTPTDTSANLLATQNLPAPTIADGSDYFKTVLDTGANIKTASEALYTYQLAWIKDRDNVASHQIIIPETTNVTYPDSNAPEGTYAAPTGNSVGWVWNLGTAVASNTDGSVTSSIAANTTSGVSAGTYTGTGSNLTFGHGLPTAPKFVHVKRLDGGNNGGNVWFTGLTGSQYLELHTTDAIASAATVWNSTVPSDTVISIGTSLSSSGLDYFFMAFSEVEGFSKFGSYTGNGSTDGPFVYCGFRLAFILYKKTSGGGQWGILDNKRDTYNPAYRRLFPDASDAENTGVNPTCDFLSNGFKMRNTNSDLNASGGTYIFAAFAEHPFQGGTADSRSQVRAR